MKKTIIHQMFRLEQLCYSKFITEELLNDLISLYVKSIDTIDGHQSFAKIYFLEKMQSIVAKSETHVYITKEENHFQSDQYANVLNTSDVDNLNDFPDFLRRIENSSDTSSRSSSISEKPSVQQKERDIKIDKQFSIMNRQLKKNQDYLINKLKKQLKIKERLYQDLFKSSEMKKLQQKSEKQSNPKNNIRKLSQEYTIKQLLKSNSINKEQNLLKRQKKSKQQKMVVFQKQKQRVNLNNSCPEIYKYQEYKQNNSQKNKRQSFKKLFIELQSSCQSYNKAQKRSSLTIEVPKRNYTKQRSKQHSDDDGQNTPEFKLEPAWKNICQREESITNEDIMKWQNQETNAGSDDISSDNYF